jgi:hypothetical protein
MLSQTRYAIEKLKESGIQRKDFSVRTPFDYKHKGWGEVRICIFNSETYATFKIIRKLLKSFNVTICTRQGKAVHVSITDSYNSKGFLTLYSFDTDSFKYIGKKKNNGRVSQ